MDWQTSHRYEGANFSDTERTILIYANLLTQAKYRDSPSPKAFSTQRLQSIG